MRDGKKRSRWKGSKKSLKRMQKGGGSQIKGRCVCVCLIRLCRSPGKRPLLIDWLIDCRPLPIHSIAPAIGDYWSGVSLGYDGQCIFNLSFFTSSKHSDNRSKQMFGENSFFYSYHQWLGLFCPLCSFYFTHYIYYVSVNVINLRGEYGMHFCQ